MQKPTDKIKKEVITRAKVMTGAFGMTPGDINDGVIERIIEPPEGGVFIKFIGCSYLYKGTNKQSLIDLLAFPKRLLVNVMAIETAGPRFIRTKLVKLLFGIFLLLPNWLIKRIMTGLIGFYLQSVYLKPIQKHLIVNDKRYSPAVREIWRVLTIFIGEIKDDKIQRQAFRLRNLVCLIFNTDLPHRLKLQDILSEIDIKAQSPRKEIGRVLDIFISRIRNQHEIGMWGNIKKLFIVLSLRFYRPMNKWLVRFFSEVDLEKIKLDEADWYFTLQRDDYNYRGVSLEDRRKEKKRIDKEKGHFMPSVKVLSRGDE